MSLTDIHMYRVKRDKAELLIKLNHKEKQKQHTYINKHT